MSDDKKKICFIDSSYNPLFYIADGENVVLTYSDGERAVRPCKFLDEYHTQVGNNIFHICQFAEIMERNGTSYVPEKPQKLPELCYGILPAGGELILIRRGEKGYRKCSDSSPHREQNEMIAAQNNRRLGVTPQQSAAMLAGSLFGWACPAAQTSSYDLKGAFIRPAPKAKSRTKISEVDR